MRLVVISIKPCWEDPKSPTGYSTDGGFQFQMAALSELFDATEVLVPCLPASASAGKMHLTGRQLTVRPLGTPPGRGWKRKAIFPFWLALNGVRILDAILTADAVHTPIPGDIGTIGMLIALALRKPLFVRHCGNWLNPKTTADRFWRWSMEFFGGHRNVMLATGGGRTAPSNRNPNVEWIFSSSLWKQDLVRLRRPREAFNRESPRLVIACRQEPDKGTALVIESLSRIAASFPQVSLEVVGDGSALGDLKRLARKLKVEDRVTFAGRLTHGEVLSRLSQADLLCYPTRASEGFPKVILEAMACGLPIVTTPVSILPELLGDKCGYLLEETSVEALSAAVVRCLKDEAAYRAMSAAAVERACSYSLEDWRDTIGRKLTRAWGPLCTHGSAV